MKVFVAGATGAVGKRLLPLLRQSGHDVVGTTRSPERARALELSGATPIVVDALDREAIIEAVVSARPQVIVHQMTALTRMRNLRRFDEEFAETNRLRTEGTRWLLDAGRRAGVERVVVQSYTGWPYAKTGARVKSEADALDPAPRRSMQRTLDAIRRLESSVLEASYVNGIVLRYGAFYGPGTALAPEGDLLQAVRGRRFPIVGSGKGVWSFVHIDDVARATALAVMGAPSGIYNIVDDEPAEVAVWLPELARVLGAKPPRHVPAWVAKFMIGEAGVSMMTDVRGASNAKAKRVLKWQLTYVSWREGFRHGLVDRPLREMSATAAPSVSAG